MEREHYRQMSDEALAQVVANELLTDRLRGQLATCEAHRRRAEEQLNVMTSVLWELLEASRCVSDADLTTRDNDRLDAARKNAREVLTLRIHKPTQ